jgi:hypothetical protein
LSGYLLAPMPYWQCGALIAAALLLVKPGLETDIAGGGLAALVVTLQYLARKKQPAPAG